jgi:hypothetical protein
MPINPLNGAPESGMPWPDHRVRIRAGDVLRSLRIAIRSVDHELIAEPGPARNTVPSNSPSWR